MGCSASSEEMGAPRGLPGAAICHMSTEDKKQEKIEEHLRLVEASMTAAAGTSNPSDGKSETLPRRILSAFGLRKDEDVPQQRSPEAAFVPKASTASTSSNRRASWARRGSEAQFAAPDQTIIIFDWDDTLCPTTWILNNVEGDDKGNPCADSSHREYLKPLAKKVIQVLKLAQSIGEVVMVTNAQRPWVDTSLKAFLPSCKAVLKPIPVCYAEESMSDPSEFKAEDDLYLAQKACAMKAAVTNFYSRYENQSWKNVISIGDAFFEHEAIRQVTNQRPDQANNVKKCRTKTIKLLQEPTVENMVVQLSIVVHWLAKIIQLDEDLDIDMASDEDALNLCVTKFGPASTEPILKPVETLEARSRASTEDDEDTILFSC